MSFLYHSGNDSLSDNKRSVQIDIYYLTELGSRHFDHGYAFDDTGIVYQNIDRPDFFFYLCDQCIDLFFIGNVAHISVSLDAGFLISGKTFIYQFLFDIVENDGSTGLGKSAGNCKSDTIRSSRYKSNFSF